MCQQLSVSTFQYFPKLCKLFSLQSGESLTDYASYVYRLDIKSFEFEMCGEVRWFWGVLKHAEKYAYTTTETKENRHIWIFDKTHFQ